MTGLPRLEASLATSSSGGDAKLSALVRADQLAAIRRSILSAVPVNVLIGVAALLVAVQSGRAELGAAWFAASTTVNFARIALCLLDQRRLAGDRDGGDPAEASAEVERQLRRAGIAALVSGLVWAWLPVLSGGHTGPQTLFYLTATCGITAGAISCGTAFARIPISFITPPLLSVVGCLVWSGGFDRVCLAATVLIYLAALLRSAVQSEATFREASHLKNEARALAQSLARANAEVTEVADEMGRRATRDPLTGLLNRAGFMDEVERRVAAAPSPTCLMLLDLDGFKSVNDAFGHSTGDRVLVEVARRLTSTLPPGGAAARLGGDEFAVLYDPAATEVAPTDLAGRLIAATVLPFEALNTGRLGISVGVHHEPGVGIADMLVHADAALYAAKAAGRNRLCVFDEALRDRLELRRDTERDLPAALAERTLELWYQPIFDEGGRVLSGFEALLRWRHPRHGWVSPPEILSAAAMAGLSDALLRFVLDEACGMARRLRRTLDRTCLVAINISPREISQLPVDAIVLEALARHGIEPGALEVEITEEAAMTPAGKDKLATLSRAGVPLAVDDFGIGFSSLASLRHLRPARVKIDRSFVTGIAQSSDDRLLVGAVLGLGRSMGFEVVAEGVETIEDVVALQAVGCRLMQGYHLGRPLPADAVFARFATEGREAA